MKKSRRFEYYTASAVGVITFLVYLPSLWNGLINWDDNIYIFNNSHIRSINWAFLKWAFLDFYATNWHPLTWISFALDYSVWGLNPIGYHLMNAVLHSVNAFLVVILAIRLMEAWEKGETQNGARTFLGRDGKLVAACATGLLFGIHPLHVESVAWAAERKDVLCALFFLLSILAYIRYADNQGSRLPASVRGNGGKRPYLLCLFFFALALLSKPMAVSLPLVLIILDWYPLGRTGPFKVLLAEKSPFLSLSGLSAVLTVMAQKTGGAIKSLRFAPLPVRALVVVKSLACYLWKMAFPLDLVPFYPYPKNVSFLAPEYILASLFVIGITVFCLFLVKKQRLWIACWGYYVVTLGPVLGLVQMGDQSMADRYAYLPSLGPFMIAGLAAAWTWGKMAALKKGNLVRAAGAAAVLMAVFSMSYLTIRQIGVWKNNFVLWDYVIEKEPGQVPFAYSNRGDIYLEMGWPERAIADFNKAIALDPSFSMAYYNRGNSFERIKRLDLAIADYGKAIEENPSYAEVYNNRGFVFYQMGKLDKALQDYNKSLSLKPDFALAYVNRGNLYLKFGEKGLAFSDFQKACAMGDERVCAILKDSGWAIDFTGR